MRIYWSQTSTTSTDAGSIFYYRPQVGRFELGETSGLDDELVTRFRKLDIAAGTTGLDEAIASRQPLQVPDVLKRPNNALRDAALEAGLRAALIVPLLGSEAPLARWCCSAAARANSPRRSSI